MLKPVEIDGQAYLAPSWKEMGELTVKMAREIKKTNGDYDRIVALAKGGLGWVRQLQDILEIKELSSLQVSFYTDINTTKTTPVVIQSLPISIRDERVLIYDDVVDSGETLRLARDYLPIHGAKKVESCAHFTKSWTKVHPDYSVADTDAWIIFPHDALETIRSLQNKWEGVSEDKVRERLLRIGVEPAIVEYAMDHS